MSNVPTLTDTKRLEGGSRRAYSVMRIVAVNYHITAASLSQPDE